MNYEEMLKRGKEQLPEEQGETIRLNIPKVKGHIQGNKTIINNFSSIADTLRRKPQHLLKFLQKELATPGDLVKGSVLFGAKLSASRINKAIEKYADIFVFCRQCGKPDTQLSSEYGYSYIKCQACGAKYSLGSKG